MATSATLKSVHISPQKVRLVANQINGLRIEKALNILNFSNKKAAKTLKKVLLSAVSNAEHNDAADIDELKVNSIQVNQSITMKRLRTRARGRADRILKRFSRVTVVVSEI